MILILIIILVAAAFWAVAGKDFFMVERKFPEAYAIQQEIHKYSGINPDLYIQYLNSVNLAKDAFGVDKNLAIQYLTKGIDELREITLSLPANEMHIADEINELADKLFIMLKDT